MHYITIDDIYSIIKHLKADTGNDIVIMNKGLLESSLEMPKLSLFGKEQYPELYQKAAILMETLTKNHCLSDGNKRCGMIAAALMLQKNEAVLVHPLKAVRFSVDTARDSDDAMRDEIQMWFKTHTALNDTQLSVMLEERLGEEYVIDELLRKGSQDEAENIMDSWLCFDNYPEHKKSWDSLQDSQKDIGEYMFKYFPNMTPDPLLQSPLIAIIHITLEKIKREQDLSLRHHTLENLSKLDNHMQNLIKQIDEKDILEYKYRKAIVLYCFGWNDEALECCDSIMSNHPSQLINYLLKIYFQLMSQRYEDFSKTVDECSHIFKDISIQNMLDIFVYTAKILQSDANDAAYAHTNLKIDQRNIFYEFFEVLKHIKPINRSKVKSALKEILAVAGIHADMDMILEAQSNTFDNLLNKIKENPDSAFLLYQLLWIFLISNNKRGVDTCLEAMSNMPWEEMVEKIYGTADKPTTSN